MEEALGTRLTGSCRRSYDDDDDDEEEEEEEE